MHWLKAKLPASWPAIIHIFLLMCARVTPSHGYYSRVATISFSASGGVATIRERLLIKSGIWSSKYGSHDNAGTEWNRVEDTVNLFQMLKSTQTFKGGRFCGKLYDWRWNLCFLSHRATTLCVSKIKLTSQCNSSASDCSKFQTVYIRYIAACQATMYSSETCSTCHWYQSYSNIYSVSQSVCAKLERMPLKYNNR